MKTGPLVLIGGGTGVGVTTTGTETVSFTGTATVSLIVTVSLTVTATVCFTTPAPLTGAGVAAGAQETMRDSKTTRIKIPANLRDIFSSFGISVAIVKATLIERDSLTCRD